MRDEAVIRAAQDRRLTAIGAASALGRTLLMVALALSFAPALRAQFQMPDPKQMSGIPRPVDDLPAGSITVRVIRGSLANNITGQPVQVLVNGKTTTAKTDDGGRAEFTGLAAGATVKASTDVDGEHLESQEFQVPPTGGVRLMLVATDKAAASKPAVTGAVAIGSQSRFVIEPAEESLQVYYLLMVENRQSAPVNPPQVFAFDMPTGALGTSVLQGSSALVSVSGAHVTVRGPFPPGQTLVQVACELPAASGAVDIEQRFPAPLDELNVVVKKVGDTSLASPDLRTQQDMTSEGDVFIAATGGAVPAGQAVRLSLSGLPHHNTAGRWIALTLAVFIVVFGAWASRVSADEGTMLAERKRLETRRDKLMGELARLEIDHQAGRADAARYAERRRVLIPALEQLYGALDDGTAVLPGARGAQRRATPAPAVVKSSAANA
jgi:hypothetical protein